MKHIPGSTRSGWLAAAAAVCLTGSSGCTSVISSAYLREAWLDAVEHAAEAREDAEIIAASKPLGDEAAGADDEAVGGRSDPEGGTQPIEPAPRSPATLAEAVGEAELRLAATGGLSEAARGTLVATLEATPRQDWLIVVEEFTAALAAAAEISGPGPAAAVSAPVIAQPAAAMPAAPEPEPAMPPAEPARHEPAAHAAAQPAAVEPATPPFAVRNACFASRVRGWGAVDRFETSEFQPGQELIVYFELDQLASEAAAEGHTTRIDTTLRLVDAAGRSIHEWTFEPIVETCQSPRRDYFARYLVCLPAALPAGRCLMQVVVNDTVGGRTAHASLPLEAIDR